MKQTQRFEIVLWQGRTILHASHATTRLTDRWSSRMWAVPVVIYIIPFGIWWWMPSMERESRGWGITTNLWRWKGHLSHAAKERNDQILSMWPFEIAKNFHLYRILGSYPNASCFFFLQRGAKVFLETVDGLPRTQHLPVHSNSRCARK